MALDVTTLAYIDETGYHFSDYPTFLAAVQQSYRDIYGADIYLESDSQDGQWLAILAQSLYDTAALGGSVYNSFSPVSAQGTGLSRLVKINGLNRRSPTNSTVVVTIVGVAGTILGTVDNLAVAQDTVGNKWNIPVGTTIPGGGTIDVTATAQEMGAITAEIGTVTEIFTPTFGWQTVTNAAAATTGVPVEIDAELRGRQAVSTANPSLTVFEGSNGAVANLEGVTQVRGYENDTGSTDANGLVAHSISTMVLGGVDADIAQTIALHKTPGTQTVGVTNVLVYDSHGMPLNIKFTRPDVATVSARITLAAKTGWTVDTETTISASVAAAINEFGIGNTVLLSRLFAPAYLVGTALSETYDITTIELKKNAGAYAATNVAIDFDEYPNCDPLTNVTYVVT